MLAACKQSGTAKYLYQNNVKGITLSNAVANFDSVRGKYNVYITVSNDSVKYGQLYYVYAAFYKNGKKIGNTDGATPLNIKVGESNMMDFNYIAKTHDDQPDSVVFSSKVQ